MQHRQDNQQQRQQQLLTIADRGTAEELFKFLQGFHRRPFQNITNVMEYIGAIDEQIDFIDCTATRYNVTPLIIAAGKGSVEKTKILLVHGANPNKQCATGDTALNLAAHRQKYPIVDLLIQYKANPNLYNQAGKTALHRAVVSYNNENAHRIRTLLDAGADPHIEDRNQRIPLDEAVIANRTDVVDLLLSYDRTLIGRSYRSAIVAARLGYDKCLEILLNYGMDPNIADQTNITPLHIAVRYMKLSAVQFLITRGADPNLVNHRGETAISIAKSLPAEQRQNFLNVLLGTSIDVQSNKAGNALLQDYPLLRNHPNWTLDSDEFRSSTAVNSSVQNLLDLSNETYWCCPQSKNAWVIFDLKHQYKISGLRIVGCGNPSTPRDGHLDVSNALNGPWLQMKDFTCSITQDKKNDFFFPSFETRFIRIFLLNNHGSDEIRIQSIAFFGVDTRLLNLLEQFGLGKSLKTLLANNINDQETLLENQDEILNSSDKYLHINEHFQFIRLMQSLRSPQLTYLEWFIPPQTTLMAGEKLQTFSIAADEGLTNRVQLEEKLENSPQANIVLMKDLEPIQGRSLVDISDYTIKSPGRYKIRVVSVDSPDIHTPWQEIVVGPISPSSRSLTSERDEHLYLSSTTHFFHDTTNDKDEALLSQKKLTTTTIITAAPSSSNKENHASSIAKVYESDLDETQSSTQLISIKSIENSPYDFSITNMSTITDSSLVNYRPDQPYKPEHYTQTVASDFYDHSTNTLDDVDDGYDSSTRFNSKSTSEKYLTPTKYRSVARLPLQNILLYTGNGQPKQYDDDDDMVNYGDKIIIPTKYRLRQERINRLLANENRSRSRQPLQTAIEQDDDYEPEQLENGETSVQQIRPRSYDGQKSRKRTQPIEEPERQSSEPHYEKIDLSNESTRSRDGSQSSVRQASRKHAPPVEEPVQQKHQPPERLVPSRESSPEQLQNYRRESNRSPMPVESRDKSATQKQYSSRSDEQDQPRKRTHSVEEPVRQKSQQRNESSRESSTERAQRPVKSKYESLSHQNRQSPQQRADSDNESLSKTAQQSRKGQAQNQDLPIQNSTSPRRTSNYEPRHQRNGFRRESSPPPPPPQSQSNYYELELSPQRNGSVRQSPSPPHRSNQRRMDLDDESPEEHAQYFGQTPSQNRNTTMPISSSAPPSRQDTNYESRIRSQPLNDSSNNVATPHEEGGSNYYELEVSPERDVPLQKPPSTRRQRTDSGDESLEEHSEYYGRAPLKNRKTAAKNEPPPSNQQPSIDESQASTRARRELTNRSPSLSQQQQQQQRSNYYELNRSSKRISSSRDSPVQRHATPYEEQQLSRRHHHSPSRTSTSPKVKQPANLRNGSTYERSNSPTYSDRRVGAPTTSNNRSSPRQYEEHHISRRNDDRDPLNLLYNRYRIIDGDFELRENPSDESRSRQIQFLFKAILQGRDSDEREENIRHNPLLDQSAMGGDQRNENPTDSSNGRSANYQRTSAHAGRPSSRRKNLQSPHGKTIGPEGRNVPSDNVSSPHSPPSDPGATHTRADGDSITTSRPNVQDTDQPQVPSQPRPSSTEKEDINVAGPDDGSYTGSRKSLKTPPQPPRPRSKYYFGKTVDYSPVDDDSDGADCEMFGHSPQPRPLNNATTKRNLDYSSATNPRFPPDSNNTSSVDARFAYEESTGTSVFSGTTQQQQQQQRLPSPPQSTNGKTDRAMPNRQLSTNKPASQRVDRRASDDYINLTNYVDLNQNFSNATSSTAGFPQQYQDDANNYEENRTSNKKQEQAPPPNRFSQRTSDRQRAHHVDDDQDDSPDDDDDDDIHDRMQNDRGDATYINEIDDDDDVDNQSAQDNESQHSSVHLPSSSVNALLRQNPIRDVPTTVQPTQYSSGPQMRPSASMSTTGKDSKKGGGGFFGLFRGSKKPLEISVRTADHSHQYTSGIIPPRLPSTPTTDTSDEIVERKPFDRAHKNHYSPDPFHIDSQDNNDEDTEDSDFMSQVQLHNRDRLAQRQTGMRAGRDFGTQVDEKPMRTIGTMSDPIKTRNAGNEVQPQSSSTQTFNSRRKQHEEHDEDVMDYRPSTSHHSRDDRQTNGHYPSYRSTSLDHRNKHISASSSAPKHRDHDDYDQRRPRHRSQYHNDSRDPYISARDRYHRDQSPPSPHRIPAPPAPYRSTSPNDRHRSPSPTSRYRFPTPQRSRSRQPPVSSSSQRRSRSPQRSTSPTVSKHRTPSPPLEYRSIKPDDYEPSRKKDRPRMVSAGTDTSLDGIRSSSRRDHRSRSTSIERQYPSQSNYSNGFHRRSPTSDYQKLDSHPLKHADNTNQEFSGDNEQSSTAKRYRLRPTRNDSYTNNRESSSSPLNRSFNRPKEYTPKIHTDDHHRRSVSSSKSRRSERDDRYLDNLPDERYLQELPKGGSVSIPSTTVIQPETIPRGREPKKSSAPPIQDHFDRNRQIPQKPIHHAHERQASSDGSCRLLNFATRSFTHQPTADEVAIPFNIRYVHEGDEEFSMNDPYLRSSTWKHDDLRTRTNQIVLLPVLNSSRTHILEKQTLRGGQHLRQSQTNGNFFLATSPTFHQFDSSVNIDDSEQFIQPTTLRSEVA